MKKSILYGVAVAAAVVISGVAANSIFAEAPPKWTKQPPIKDSFTGEVLQSFDGENAIWFSPMTSRTLDGLTYRSQLYYDCRSDGFGILSDLQDLVFKYNNSVSVRARYDGGDLLHRPTMEEWNAGEYRAYFIADGIEQGHERLEIEVESDRHGSVVFTYRLRGFPADPCE